MKRSVIRGQHSSCHAVPGFRFAPSGLRSATVCGSLFAKLGRGTRRENDGVYPPPRSKAQRGRMKKGASLPWFALSYPLVSNLPMKQHWIGKLASFALIGLLPLPLCARGEEVAALKTPLVTAQSGMVVAQEAIAARIGIGILQNGGNAVDAAVAVGFAMAVTYPRAGNIGGGGFMVIHRAGGGDTVIDYRETAPAAINATSFLDAQGNADPHKSRDSALAIGVPGTVAGLALAEAKYGSGRFTLAELMAPAIALARDGIAVADDTADSLLSRSGAAGALAVVGENFSESRRQRARRRRPAGAAGPCRYACCHRQQRAARVLRRSGRGKTRRRSAGGRRRDDGGRSERLSRHRARAGPRHLSRLRHRLDAAALLRRRRVDRNAQYHRRLRFRPRRPSAGAVPDGRNHEARLCRPRLVSRRSRPRADPGGAADVEELRRAMARHHRSAARDAGERNPRRRHRRTRRS